MYSDQVIDAIEGIRASAAHLDMSQRDIVLANLIFVHQVITASESLLEEAIKASDGDLKRYFIAHIEEERDHQTWLAADLLTAGINVKAMPLSQKAIEIAGSQYYLVKHDSPLCLLGYMAVLEGFTLSLGAITQLESMHGEELFRTVRYHAEHDLNHRKHLFSVIDKYDDPRILRSAIQTATYMNEFTRELNPE